MGMYPLGHIALGYLMAKTTKKVTGYSFNTPLVWFFSILPDFDVFIPIIEHRGATHSITLIAIFAIPVLLKYTQGTPYLVAFASHSIIGDYFTSYGTKLFWPFSNDWYKADFTLRVGAPLETMLELTLFTIMIILIIHERYFKKI